MLDCRIEDFIQWTNFNPIWKWSLGSGESGSGMGIIRVGAGRTQRCEVVNEQSLVAIGDGQSDGPWNKSH